MKIAMDPSKRNRVGAVIFAPAGLAVGRSTPPNQLGKECRDIRCSGAAAKSSGIGRVPNPSPVPTSGPEQFRHVVLLPRRPRKVSHRDDSWGATVVAKRKCRSDRLHVLFDTAVGRL